MKIFHVYEPEHFEGLIKNNLLNEDSGLKLQHIFTLPNCKKFNDIAAKGGTDQKRAVSILCRSADGGVKYHPYAFDKDLLREYKALLGEWFLGIQLHEIGNNRYNDWNRLTQRLGTLPYTIENIKEIMFSPESTNPQNEPIYRFTHGTPEEYAALSRPKTIQETRRDLAWTISKRLEQTEGMILSSDGGSSRLLQRRIYFHALMSGAEFIAEEWGFVRSFYEMEHYTLSPYGQVKKEFIDFARCHKNVKAVTPFAIVLPCDLDCLHVGTGFKGPLGTPSVNFMRVVPDEKDAVRARAEALLSVTVDALHWILSEDEQGELSKIYESAPVEIQKIKDGTYRVTIPATQLVVFKL